MAIQSSRKFGSADRASVAKLSEVLNTATVSKPVV